MMTKIGNWKILLAAVLMMPTSACTEDEDNAPGDTVLAVSDNTVDFSAFETFTVVDGSDDGQTPPEDLPGKNLTTVNSAIAANLKALGLTQVADGADLLVGAFVRVEEVDAVVTGYWYDYYYGWYWGYYEDWYESDLVTFDLGTLVIDAVDTKGTAEQEDDRLVFRGAAMGVMYYDTSDASDRLESAVERIFKQWPVEK